MGHFDKGRWIADSTDFDGPVFATLESVEGDFSRWKLKKSGEIILMRWPMYYEVKI